MNVSAISGNLKKNRNLIFFFDEKLISKILGENRKIEKSWISIENFRKSKNREKLDFNWKFPKISHLENVSKNIFIIQLFEINFSSKKIFLNFGKFSRFPEIAETFEDIIGNELVRPETVRIF